jgi:hypothetical protein
MKHDDYYLDFNLNMVTRIYKRAAMVIVPMVLAWMYF